MTEKTIKEQLAEGAKEIRKETAKAKAEALKKPAAKKKAPKAKKSVSPPTRKAKKPAKEKKPKAKTAGKLEVLPKIVEPKGAIEEILEKRVTMEKNNIGMKLDPDTTAGEAVRLLDFFVDDTEISGVRLGHFINEASKLKCWGGKYLAAIASTGRSLDRLKTFASVAKNVPPALCNRHHEIKFEHLRAIAKVPALEDKKALVDEMVKAADDGKPMTVAQIKAKADRLAPRPKKRPRADSIPDTNRAATVEEKETIREIESAAAALESALSGASFLAEIVKSETAILREKLAAIGKAYGGMK